MCEEVVAEVPVVAERLAVEREMADAEVDVAADDLLRWVFEAYYQAVNGRPKCGSLWRSNPR